MLAHVDLELTCGPAPLPAVVGILHSVVPLRRGCLPRFGTRSSKLDVQVSKEKAAQVGEVGGAASAADGKGDRDYDQNEHKVLRLDQCGKREKENFVFSKHHPVGHQDREHSAGSADR